MFNKNKTLKQLVDIFEEVLLCELSDDDLSRPYVEMGVDSLLVVQIAKLIKYYFDFPIKSSDLFKFNSIKDLAVHIDSVIAKSNDQTDAKLPVEQERDCIPDEDDSVVIIGMAGRFSDLSSIDEYWDNLIGNKEITSTSSRWQHFNNKNYTAGFCTNIDQFDSDFFNISPKEALSMDPQQRILLECSFHAFEDAGLTIQDMENTNCGVFTTALPGDYKTTLADSENAYTAFSFLGNASSVLSGRIAHFFNLKGPAIHIDTACSSSLVAIHSACNHIKSDICDMAIVGAASLFATPEIFHLADAANMQSKSGKCSVFDDEADGFIPGEAVACLVLCKYSSAIKNNHKILAIIKDIAVNHDGYTNGIMSPNGNAQEQLIYNLYNKNNIDLCKLGYIEAHGTGTKIGDPIEVNALTSAFSKLYPSHQDFSCYIGSVKANIGHSLVASGMASIAKVIKIFSESAIPGQINYQNLNHEIDLGKFAINTKNVKWDSSKKYAGISSFGFSGTNSHLILEKPPNNCNTSKFEPVNENHTFIFSAKSKSSLNVLLGRYVDFIKKIDNKDMAALSYNLFKYRSQFKYKLVAQAEDKYDLLDNINKFLSGESDSYNESGADNPNINSSLRYVKMALPQYPFDSKSYWFKQLAKIDKVTNNHASQEQVLSSQGVEKDQIKIMLKQKIAEILNYEVEDLKDHVNLFSYGVDSLVSIQLLSIFENDYGKLNNNILFNHDTIESLAEYLSTYNCERKVANNYLTATSENCPHSSNCPGFLNAINSKRLMLTIDGNSIEVYVFGDEHAHPLLLLPPLNTSYLSWIQQIRYFTRLDYQIIIPHYPGHESSTFFPCSLNEIANHISRIITRHLNCNSINIVGWSIGGCIALILGKKLKDRVAKIAIINAPTEFETDVFAKSISLRNNLEKYKDYFVELYLDDNENSVDFISSGASLDVLKHYYDSLKLFNFTNELKELSQEFLIIYGSDDPVITPSNIYKYKNLKLCTIKKIESEGHFIPLTRPLLCNTMLENFLS